MFSVARSLRSQGFFLTAEKIAYLKQFRTVYSYFHKPNFIKFQGLMAYNLAKILQKNGEFGSTVYKTTENTFGKIFIRWAKL